MARTIIDTSRWYCSVLVWMSKWGDYDVMGNVNNCVNLRVSRRRVISKPPRNFKSYQTEKWWKHSTVQWTSLWTIVPYSTKLKLHNHQYGRRSITKPRKYNNEREEYWNSNSTQLHQWPQTSHPRDCRLERTDNIWECPCASAKERDEFNESISATDYHTGSHTYSISIGSNNSPHYRIQERNNS